MVTNPPSRSRRGRPPALDATKREVVVALLTAGWTRARAARYVGVAPQTVLNTAARDPAFAARLNRAEARARAQHYANIAAASGRSWRASAWALERLAARAVNPTPGPAVPLADDPRP